MWVLELTITEELWKQTKIAAKFNITSLLDSASALIATVIRGTEHSDSKTKVCAGLYAYALEEYGKLLLLLECKPANGEVKFGYRNQFRHHRFKIEKASGSLPAECLTIHKGGFRSGPGNFRGGSGNFDVDTKVNWVNRLLIFHTDFRMDGLTLESPRAVDPPLLEDAVNKLSEIVKNVNVN